MNNWLEQYKGTMNIPEAVFADIKLCLNEIVANTISYGFPDSAGEADILVTLKFDDKQANVNVIDNGIPFNPLKAPEQAAITDIDSARIGGFGLMLVRKTAHVLSYKFEDRTNVLPMLFGYDRTGADSPE